MNHLAPCFVEIPMLPLPSTLTYSQLSNLTFEENEESKLTKASLSQSYMIATTIVQMLHIFMFLIFLLKRKEQVAFIMFCFY